MEKAYICPICGSNIRYYKKLRRGLSRFCWSCGHGVIPLATPQVRNERVMRLKRVIAEWYYLKDTHNAPVVPFDEQDSNVQDFYSRIATNEIPKLLHGYISNHGWLGNVVRGCIRDFINAHGVQLNGQNYNSLAKRIISRIKGQISSEGYKP